METILVSACLLGIKCRYDGKGAYHRGVSKFFKNNHIIFACPEQLGGLSTPRPRSKIKGECVVNELGFNVTENFYRGAKEFLKIAKLFKVDKLILKSKSPSCGKKGIVVKLLSSNIPVIYL